MILNKTAALMREIKIQLQQYQTLIVPRCVYVFPGVNNWSLLTYTSLPYEEDHNCGKINKSEQSWISNW